MSCERRLSPSFPHILGLRCLPLALSTPIRTEWSDMEVTVYRWLHLLLHDLKEFDSCLNSTGDSVELFRVQPEGNKLSGPRNNKKHPQASCILKCYAWTQTLIPFCMPTASIPLTLANSIQFDNFSAFKRICNQEDFDLKAAGIRPRFSEHGCKHRDLETSNLKLNI